MTPREQGPGRNTLRKEASLAWGRFATLGSTVCGNIQSRCAPKHVDARLTERRGPTCRGGARAAPTLTVDTFAVCVAAARRLRTAGGVTDFVGATAYQHARCGRLQRTPVSRPTRRLERDRAYEDASGHRLAPARDRLGGRRAGAPARLVRRRRGGSKAEHVGIT